HQQDLADRRALGVRTEERVLAGRAVDRSRLEELPAVEDRLGVDARRAAAGRAALEQHVRRPRARTTAPAAARARRHRPARAQPLELDVLAVEAEHAIEVGLEARVALNVAGALEDLLLAARGRRVRARRVREQPLLGGLLALGFGGLAVAGVLRARLGRALR